MEVARSIKILKDGDISIDSYPKDKFPREYHKWKYDHKEGNVYKWLLEQLDSYEIQPLDSADHYKWWGILKQLNDRNLKGETRLKVFKELAEEKVSDKSYYIVLNLQIANQGIVYGKINKNKLEFTSISFITLIRYPSYHKLILLYLDINYTLARARTYIYIFE